ncbi:MAG: hypothetical protein AAFV95_26550 [Bacteroidota bacterium]
MKNIPLFCLLAILLSAAACTTEQPKEPVQQPPTIQQAEPSPSETDNATVSVSPTHVKASDIAPFIGLWSFTKPMCREEIRNRYYRGRWIQFSGDGTFTFGRYQDQTNSGRFSYAGDKKIMSLDFADDSDTDIDWKVMQGVDIMIWLGNAAVNTTGDQIQLKKVKERPNKPAGQ